MDVSSSYENHIRNSKIANDAHGFETLKIWWKTPLQHDVYTPSSCANWSSATCRALQLQGIYPPLVGVTCRLRDELKRQMKCVNWIDCASRKHRRRAKTMQSWSIEGKYLRGRLPIIRTREVQAVVCNHSLHRVYVIYTLGDCTLLELANHVYYVVGGIL